MCSCVFVCADPCAYARLCRPRRSIPGLDPAITKALIDTVPYSPIESAQQRPAVGTGGGGGNGELSAVGVVKGEQPVGVLKGEHSLPPMSPGVWIIKHIPRVQVLLGLRHIVV